MANIDKPGSSRRRPLVLALCTVLVAGGLSVRPLPGSAAPLQIAQSGPAFAHPAADRDDEDNGRGYGDSGDGDRHDNGHHYGRDKHDDRDGDSRDGGWRDRDDRPGYGTNSQYGRGLSGTVDSFGGYNLALRTRDGFRQVRLHPGTIINPTGTTLRPGMRVRITGTANGNTFDAYRIDVVGY